MNIQGFLLIFALFFNLSARAEVVDRVEAVINKKAIYKSDVRKFRTLAPLRLKIDPLFANNPLSKKVAVDSEIIDFLVAEALILDKFPVSDAEVEQEINSIQASLRIDRPGLKAAINREGFLFEDYQMLMRVSIAKRQLIDRDIRSKTSVSEDDLKAEYNRSHSSSKSFNGTFHLYLIKVTKINYKSVKYAKDLFDQALKDLASGQPFDEVAKKTSDDSSANDGGDLGFLAYHEISTTLQREVQKMVGAKTLDKNLINSFEDKDSFNILKVTEVSKDVDSGFEKEKENLRGKLMDGEFQHQIQLWIDRQRGLNYIRVNQPKA